MKQCRTCQTANSDVHTYCHNCGNRLATDEAHAQAGSSSDDNFKLALKLMWAWMLDHVIIKKVIVTVAGMLLLYLGTIFGKRLLLWAAAELKTNRPPKIVRVEWDKRPVPAGTSVTLIGIVSDEDGDIPEFHWECSRGDIDWVRQRDKSDYNGYRAVLKAPPDRDVPVPSNIKVTFKASDWSDKNISDTKVIEVDLIPQRAYNRPPNLGPIKTDSYAVFMGNKAELNVTASDDDGDLLNFDWEGPTGTIIPNGENAVFNTSKLKPEPNQFTVKVTVKVDDKRGGQAQQAIDLVILPYRLKSNGGNPKFSIDRHPIR